ncbi:hypothetical protein CRUP_000429 [Coryphaenoides rupestris]|nr:hypothetical protein CRUP_000429 [Coryphaenoides rupestris]
MSQTRRMFTEDYSATISKLSPVVSSGWMGGEACFLDTERLKEISESGNNPNRGRQLGLESAIFFSCLAQ